MNFKQFVEKIQIIPDDSVIAYGSLEVTIDGKPFYDFNLMYTPHKEDMLHPTINIELKEKGGD